MIIVCFSTSEWRVETTLWSTATKKHFIACILNCKTTTKKVMENGGDNFVVLPCPVLMCRACAQCDSSVLMYRVHKFRNYRVALHREYIGNYVRQVQTYCCAHCKQKNTGPITLYYFRELRAEVFLHPRCIQAYRTDQLQRTRCYSKGCKTSWCPRYQEFTGTRLGRGSADTFPYSSRHLYSCNAHLQDSFHSA
jgi:hypothetical protein